MSVVSSAMDLLRDYPYQTLAVSFFGYILFRLLKKNRNGNPNGLPLPPGPKGYPLIGSLFDMPVIKPWVVYEQWCKTYGDMVYFNVLGQHFLILGSLQRTTDLLGKRSSNYSDRTHLPMLMDLMGWDYHMVFMPYGLQWRKQRKTFHEYFHINTVSKYLPIQRREVHALLRRLLVTPDNFLLHIQHIVAATSMKVIYGMDLQESHDPYFLTAEEAIDGAIEAGVPGAFLVDMLPILKYVPSWFPGAGFQKKAAHWREITTSMVEKPFHFVRDQLKDRKAVPSVATTLIERLPHEDDPQRHTEERLAECLTASAYVAAAETSAGTLEALFLALALYPEVQKKAQAEIDAVVGPNRLPDFEDRPSLPYINAVVKESLRWHSVLPFGVPQMVTNDDEYEGYYIPKGTIVLANAWSILHDPKVFDNPMEYRPERYLKAGKLNPDVRDPDCAAFGFGRRICPGRHLADNSLYLLVACLLAVYDIKPPVDEQGNIIKLKPKFTNGISSHAAPFKCIIKPRTPAAETLVRHSVHEDD